MSFLPNMAAVTELNLIDELRPLAEPSLPQKDVKRVVEAFQAKVTEVSSRVVGSAHYRCALPSNLYCVISKFLARSNPILFRDVYYDTANYDLARSNTWRRDRLYAQSLDWETKECRTLSHNPLVIESAVVDGLSLSQFPNPLVELASFSCVRVPIFPKEFSSYFDVTYIDGGVYVLLTVCSRKGQQTLPPSQPLLCPEPCHSKVVAALKTTNLKRFQDLQSIIRLPEAGAPVLLAETDALPTRLSELLTQAESLKLPASDQEDCSDDQHDYSDDDEPEATLEGVPRCAARFPQTLDPKAEMAWQDFLGAALGLKRSAISSGVVE